MGTGTDIVTVELPVPPDDSATDVGLNETVYQEGTLSAVRFSVPENPLMLDRVMVEVPVPVDPGATSIEAGLASILKSGPVTVTARVEVRVVEPLVALTAIM
jgi:hypothetical protein